MCIMNLLLKLSLLFVRKSVVVLSSKEGTPATNLDPDKTLENFYEEADPGSEDDSSSLEMKTDTQSNNAKKVSILVGMTFAEQCND